MRKLNKYIYYAKKFEIFESLDDVAGESLGEFIVADPFVSEIEFQEWRSRLKHIPAWLNPCKKLAEFQTRVDELAAVIHLIKKEKLLDKVRAGYNYSKSKRS